jgi:hypothetical protein
MKRACNVFQLLLIAPLAFAANTQPAQEQKDSLDTVVVEGRLHQLEKLRDEMVLVEDRFYERYNALNPIRDFDTHCYIESRTGTRTKSRYCRAVYQERAFEREGQDYSEALKWMMNQGADSGDPSKPGAGTAPMPWVPPTPSTVMIEARRKDYQNNIRDVVKRNPELIELLRQRYELGQRYESTRRSLFEPKAREDDNSEPATPVTP